MRIGLISDTHLQVEDLQPEVYRAFAGVDLILHAGDIYAAHVIDELATLAPVFAARGNGDRGRTYDERVQDVHVLTLGGLRVGMVHELIQSGTPRAEAVTTAMERHFGGAVDIFIFGHTHVPLIEQVNGTLLINPGSTTYPYNRMRQLGHVALLEVSHGQIEARILSLTDFVETP
jgi:putative phosphoesterase